MDHRSPFNSVVKAIIGAAVVGGAVAMLSAFALTAVPRAAQATPAFATQTKLACGRCHTNPAGGGALTGFGEKFKANGYKIK